MSFSPEAEAVLVSYDWPGNVRQLQNVVQNTVVLNDGEIVLPAMLPAPLDGALAPARMAPAAKAPAETPRSGWSSASAGQDIRPLAEIEREAIERAIAACGGNVPKAAALLGVSASTIYRKRESWVVGR